MSVQTAAVPASLATKMHWVRVVFLVVRVVPGSGMPPGKRIVKVVGVHVSMVIAAVHFGVMWVRAPVSTTVIPRVLQLC